MIKIENYVVRKPIQKSLIKSNSEFDRTDNRLREARKAAGEIIARFNYTTRDRNI